MPLRIFFRRNNLSITHMDDPVAVGRRFRVVRDHQHRLTQFLVRMAKHLQHDFGILSIEVAGRFVGKHNCGTPRAAARRPRVPPADAAGVC